MIVLLATELATNAILHSRLPFEVTVALTAHCAQVCVDDLSPLLPSVTRPADTETSGRGRARSPPARPLGHQGDRCR